MLRDSLNASMRVCELLSPLPLPKFFQGKFTLPIGLTSLLELLSNALLGELPLRTSEGIFFVIIIILICSAYAIPKKIQRNGYGNIRKPFASKQE